MLRYLLDYSYVFFYDHDHSIGTPIIIKIPPSPAGISLHITGYEIRHYKRKKLQKILTTQMSIRILDATRTRNIINEVLLVQVMVGSKGKG